MDELDAGQRPKRRACERGRSEAAGIVEMFAYHGQREIQMEKEDQWASALTKRCSTALRLSRAFAEYSDSLVNYDQDTCRDLGEVFAVAAAVVMLCRADAVSRGFPLSDIREYDRQFSELSRDAFKTMLASGAYASMDAIRDRCDELATSIAERLRHYGVEPFAILDAAARLTYKK